MTHGVSVPRSEYPVILHLCEVEKLRTAEIAQRYDVAPRTIRIILSKVRAETDGRSGAAIESDSEPLAGVADDPSSAGCLPSAKQPETLPGPGQPACDAAHRRPGGEEGPAPALATVPAPAAPRGIAGAPAGAPAGPYSAPASVETPSDRLAPLDQVDGPLAPVSGWGRGASIQAPGAGHLQGADADDEELGHAEGAAIPVSAERAQALGGPRKRAYGLVVRTGNGDESLMPYPSLGDLLSSLRQVFRTAVESGDPPWFSVREVEEGASEE